MRGVNKVILMGNVGKDPDISQLEGNVLVAKFPLATSDTYKDKTGKVIAQTEWHSIIAWRGLAELAKKYLHKGSYIYIEGKLHHYAWQDAEGNKRFSTEIIAENLILLDKKNGLNPMESTAVAETPHSHPISPNLTNSVENDDFPF